MEEDFWKLKSRVQWLHERDANTKFFYLTTLNENIRTVFLSYVTHGELDL